MTFQKGQSGNPGGRPKSHRTFAATLRAQLDRVKNGLTTRERIAAVVMDKALDGDIEVIKWLVDRVDGKVPDKIEADVDARVTPALDERTRLAILAFAARRRALDRSA